MPRGRAGDDGAATSDGQTLSPARGLSRALRAAAPTLERRRSTKGRSGTVYEGIGVNRATATLSDAAVVSLDEAMVGQSALAWTFEQDGFEEAYQWEASLEDGPAFNSGSLSEDTANHEAAERRFSFEADKPPVPPKEVAVTGGMADSSWTSATTSHKRSSSDIAYLAHSESTILNPGGSLPRISSAARFHGATRPSPSFGSAQPERKSPESPNDPAALDSDGVSQLRYRLVECEKQLELERERRLMLDAIWTNPYGNDAVGIVEVVFSPTRQGDQPESPNPSTPIPVDLVVFEMNPRAAGRFNRSPDTIRGARMSELVDEATLARMLEPYALALETGEAQHFEHHAPPLPMSQDDRGMYTLKLVGRDSYFKTTVTHIGSNRITGSPICCFFENNVTHFKKQEREMRAKNLELADALGKAEVASKAKDEFLGMISHEIRTPLNGILGHLALLKETHLEPNQLEYVDTVVECSEGLLSLVNDILDLSRAAANKIELDEGPFDLHSMLRTSFAVYKTAEARLRMVLDIDNTVPNWVIGDSKRLRQVLINLISNSVKFTEFGGIECRVRCEPSGPPPPRSVTPEAPSSPPRAGSGGFGIPMDGDIPEELAGWLRLSIDVQDTGIGIPAEYIPKLFQPFQQIDSSMSRKYQGTGLGLAICRKIVELMHGQIGVRSDGNGSTFSFTVFVRACPPDLEGGQKSLERKKKAILSNRVRREREIMAMGGAPWDEVRALGRGLSGSLSNHSSDDSSGRRGAYLGYPPRTGPSSNYSSLPRGNSGPLPSSYRSASPVPSPDERILSLDRSLDRYKRHDEDEDGELLEGEVPVFSVPAEALAIMDSFEPIKKQEHVDEDSVLGSAAEPGASSNPSREAIREGVVANGLFSSTPSADALEPGHVHVDRSASGTSATSLGRESSSGMVVEPHEDYSQLSVLIAEDNKINRNLLLRVLAKLGVPETNVTMACDGQQAYDTVSARESPFDVVFMDLSMPVLSGIESTRLIRQNLPLQRQPKSIVALTANAFEATRVECLAAGMDSFLTKPFRIPEIQAVLDTIAVQLPGGALRSEAEEKLVNETD